MAQRRVVVDLSKLIRRDAGAGIGLKRLTAGLGRLKDVHETLRRGAEADRWPHLRLPTDAALLELATIVEDLRGRGKVLAVVGQPSAVLAVRMIVEALAPWSGLPGIPFGRPVAWVTSADPELITPLDRDDVAWLVLEGPRWADAVAEWAVARGRAVAMAGEGEHTAPPGGWWISDASAGDGRFGALGVASLLCAVWAGVDVPGLLAGARDMAIVCGRAALLENPAYSLALATVAIEQDLSLHVPVHLASTARLAFFAQWFGRMWGAVRSATRVVQGVRQHQGSAGISGLLGDEELHEALLAGVRDKFAIVWDVEPGAADPQAFGAGEAAVQVSVFLQLWQREGLPAIRLRVPGLDAGTFGGAIVLSCHAAVTAALFLEGDPLALDGVAAWYAALEVGAADHDAPFVDGGVRTA